MIINLKDLDHVEGTVWGSALGKVDLAEEPQRSQLEHGVRARLAEDPELAYRQMPLALAGKAYATTRYPVNLQKGTTDKNSILIEVRGSPSDEEPVLTELLERNPGESHDALAARANERALKLRAELGAKVHAALQENEQVREYLKENPEVAALVKLLRKMDI
ncbi:hypothetical protein [Pseudooceanicola sp. LIPI14-2-Ac024]|uniref:hypothetical protein n=1 Tax=Pseudooceanicola sp. LIPI14-2-Ac024 TaxID=3344875 RepID=UPI0035D0D5AC